MYPWLPLADITPAMLVMEALGVSEVARSPRGFLTAYRRWLVTPAWVAKRNAFIKRHMAQVNKHGESLWDADGMPTRRALALVAWAYHPEPQKWRAWLRRADLP